MGWRDSLASETTRKDRKNGKDDPITPSYLSGISGISEGAGDPATEARRQRVLAMLEANPTARYALVTDTQANPEAVILTLAIRGRATCEFRIPPEKYDPFLLLHLIEQHGATAH